MYILSRAARLTIILLSKCFTAPPVSHAQTQKMGSSKECAWERWQKKVLNGKKRKILATMTASTAKTLLHSLRQGRTTYRVEWKGAKKVIPFVSVLNRRESKIGGHLARA